MLLSEIAESIQYIPLESNSESFIGQIKQIKIFGDRIYVLDSKNNKIVIFNKKGKYLNKIEAVGKGPKEYIKIGWIDISNSDSCLYLFDSETCELLKFNQKWEYLTRWKITRYPSAFSTYKGQTCFLYVYPNYVSNNYYSLSIYNAAMINIKKMISNVYITKEEVFRSRGIGDFLFAEVCDTLVYWEHKKDNIIYHITEKNNAIKRYELVLPGSSLSRDNLGDISDDDIFDVLESCGYLFFTGNYRGIAFRGFYNKAHKKLTILSKKYANEFGYGFINDIDSGLQFWPEGITEDGTQAYSTFYGIDLKEFLDHKKDIGSKLKQSKVSKKLIDLVNNSNVIIMIVALK